MLVFFCLVSFQFTTARYLQLNTAVCQATECYQGGIISDASKCDRQTEECPPCLTGTSSEAACYDSVDETCQFGVDCRGIEIKDDGAEKKEDTNEENENPSTPTEEENTTSSGSNERSSDMPLILGIAGGTMAVLAVGIAMLMLVKRGSEPMDDDQEFAQESFEPYFGAKSVEPVPFEPKTPTPVEEPDIVAPERESGTSCEFDDRDTSWSYDYSSSSNASDSRVSVEF